MDTESLYSLFLGSSGVTTDSRTIRGGELFIALKGENFDGNEYAADALGAGAAYALVDKGSRYDGTDERIIAVPDTLAALKDLARRHRNRLRPDGTRVTVLGLTGTNGKTTTKELIREVLSVKYRVTATKGNLNNDIGVPLSLLEIGADTEIAVIEMGANHPDDIRNLVSVAEPDYGLITNVGKAHLLGFGSFEGVKAAKGQLYDYIGASGKAVFLNVDDADLTEMAEKRPGLAAVPYGLKYCGVRILPSDSGHPFLRMVIPGGEGEKDMKADTSLVGAYNACNVLAAITVGRFFGIPSGEAVAAVSGYVPSNNRSQMVRTSRNTLIVDAYNANPTSMAAALDNFASAVSGRKVALLGEMRELGQDSFREHAAIVRRLRDIDMVMCALVGEEFRKAAESEERDERIRCFGSSDELRSWLTGHPVENALVLVKGSRGTMMEKAVPAL